MSADKISPNKINGIIISVILIAAIAFGFQHFFSGGHSGHAAKNSTAPLFAATFPDQTGKPQSLKQYAGKTVVLNFWATWCEPCREEMPELSKLHDAHKNNNIVVLGLAVDEVAAISEFTKETKVSYPLFAADLQGMDIASNLGNDKSVLPFTVIIKPDGTVAKIYFGRISKALLEETLLKLPK